MKYSLTKQIVEEVDIPIDNILKDILENTERDIDDEDNHSIIWEIQDNITYYLNKYINYHLYEQDELFENLIINTLIEKVKSL